MVLNSRWERSSLSEIDNTTNRADNVLSILEGPTETELCNIPLGNLLKRQAKLYPSKECVVFSETGQRLTYQQMYLESLTLAKSLLASGMRSGDCVGIFAGNRLEYVKLLFATAHIGAIYVVLNCSYTATELKAAIKHAECKLLIIASKIGKQSNAVSLEMLSDPGNLKDMPDLREVILLNSESLQPFTNYKIFEDRSKSIPEQFLLSAINAVLPDDVCNLQFTSGTTGSPKAAMLTHNNIVNNARFVGDRMSLTSRDILACPPPLFHCFGLVLGLLAAITHGSCTVFPSETFDPAKTLKAVLKERCTALHGVPAMFSAQLQLLKPDMDFSDLRTGIAAGSSVPQKMMEDLRTSMNLLEITNTYGMTETSPASFMTTTHDPLEKRLTTVGRILPHMRAKIIDRSGRIVPLGGSGELYVAGFALQKGYWRDQKRTGEVMRRDGLGTLWMHTGDEAVFDKDGYCRITGRIKDIIIRGGENIFPLEIEERLIRHPAVLQVSVVGLPDDKYGEVVCAFIELRKGYDKPSLQEIQLFVREKLGWHKAPAHVFWIEGRETFPKTASGKIQKHILKSRGEQRFKKRLNIQARL